RADCPESDGWRSGIGHPFLRRIVPGPLVDHYRRYRTLSGYELQVRYNRWHVREGYNHRNESSRLGSRYRFVWFVRGENDGEWTGHATSDRDGAGSGRWNHYRERP